MLIWVSLVGCSSEGGVGGASFLGGAGGGSCRTLGTGARPVGSL